MDTITVPAYQPGDLPVTIVLAQITHWRALSRHGGTKISVTGGNEVWTSIRTFELEALIAKKVPA